MTERRLSFVIPARNEEALIGEAVEAVLASVARAAATCACPAAVWLSAVCTCASAWPTARPEPAAASAASAAFWASGCVSRSGKCRNANSSRPASRSRTRPTIGTAAAQ